MKPNRLQRAVAENRIPLGHMIWEFGTRGIAKILESADLDFVLLDMEHSEFDTDRVADLLAWFKATDIAPIVRVPQTLYHFIARVLDGGALGVMCANVESGEQARRIVGASKYPPSGWRGVGLGGAHTDYKNPDPVAYFDWANRNSTVICQIESVKGLENLDEIASTPGVDILWVGHFDLTTSMGIPGQFHDPDAVAALKRVAASAQAHGILAGIQPGSTAQAEEWLAFGYNVISWKADSSLYGNALRSELGMLRDLVANK
jgi:2-dehydro-3-deoxyglucarate aldolase/4-hydroxy-2-oxoheptanedioate aldolase